MVVQVLLYYCFSRVSRNVSKAFFSSLETYELYDAGSPITKMQFRITEDHQLTEEWNYMQRCLALAVDKGDKGELHELTLTTAGDIETSRIFEGFGPIKDMCFTFINRIQR